jgi:hypothetical protein
MGVTLTQATTQVFEILEPFESPERLKIIRAALLLLGTDESQAGSGISPPRRVEDSAGGERREFDEDLGGVSPKGRRWMTQHGITVEQIEECFHVAEAQVVAEVPGASDREKTVNCYLLTGIASLLKTGEPRFEDAAARALCEHEACYDATNHSKYIKFGNLASGDKAKGWTLLAPGLKTAAALVQKLATHADG